MHSGFLDLESWKQLVLWHTKEKTDALLVGGTTGEGATLSSEELATLIQVAKETSPSMPIFANVGTNCTKKSVEKAQIAKNLGVEQILVVAPYYNKPPFAGIVRHLQEITQVGLPVIFYYHPHRTSISLTEAQLIEILQIKGVVAIKEASGDLTLTRKILSIHPDAIIYSGNDEDIVPFMQLGGFGSISVTGNVLPSLWKSIIEAGARKNYLEMKASFHEVHNLIQALLLEVNPIPVKCALSLLGKCKNSLRLPLIPAETRTLNSLQNALSQFFVASYN